MDLHGTPKMNSTRQTTSSYRKDRSISQSGFKVNGDVVEKENLSNLFNQSQSILRNSKIGGNKPSASKDNTRPGRTGSSSKTFKN